MAYLGSGVVSGATPRDLTRLSAALDATDDLELDRLAIWFLDLSTGCDKANLFDGRRVCAAIVDAILAEGCRREAIYQAAFTDDEPGPCYNDS